MSEQLSFNLDAAIALRDEGLRRVAENSEEFLKEARGTARLICEAKGTVTADDVRRGCPITPRHPNAWGAVFKSKEFEFTGAMRQSEVETRHGGMQRVWRLRNDG